MKARKRTVYTIRWPGGTEWRGDCPVWAATPLPAGSTVTATRVLWLGPTWPCPGCANRSH